MDAQHRLDRLDGAVRDLRIEWEKFFNGSRQVPPEELREEIQQGIRTLRNVNLRSVADNFRLAQLEARFNSFSELYNRRLRQVEEGRTPGVPAVAERQPAYDPARGVVLGGEVDDAAVEALYQGLARGGGGPRFDLESFRAYLDQQVGAMREKTGCSRVRFRLEPDGGKLKLKAKPLSAGD
jgi:hypothetical protein